MNESRKRVTMPGMRMGRPICQKVRNSPAPSIRHESISVSGTASAAKMDMKYTPKGYTISGSMTPS